MNAVRFNPVAIAKYQLYLLQLEGYELLRFLRLVFKKGLLPPLAPLRRELVWTQKAVLVAVLSGALLLLAAVGTWRAAFSDSGLAVSVLGFLLVAYAFTLLSFAFFVLATVALAPVDWLLKLRTVRAARGRLARMPDVKVVAICGSFGKTTVKEAIGRALSVQRKVAVTPESVNTEVGVARWLLYDVPPETEVLVVEMGEHYEGDIRRLAALTPPDAVVVTGINEAHLERLGSLERAAGTIFEAVAASGSGTFVVLNADSAPVVEYAASHLAGRQAVWYSAGSTPSAAWVAASVFDPKGLARAVTLTRGEQTVIVTLKLLASYAPGVAAASLLVAEHFGVPLELAAKGLERLAPVKHRLEPIPGAGNVLVIDDSYNGNPDGAREAIRLLAEFQDRRKVYLTPGLVEMGEQAGPVHREIGRQLAAVADLVILVRNSVTPFVAEGLEAAGYPKGQVLWYPTAVAAHAALKDVLKPGDVILFQNDWGDQYL